MQKLSCWIYSLIVAVLFYILYPIIKSYLYSKELFDYIASLINPEPGSQILIFGLSINIIHTLVTAIVAGLIASAFLLSRLDKNWKVYGINSLTIYLIFRYLMLIVRYDTYIPGQELGVQLSYFINPVIAGIALVLAQWILSRVRSHLPSTN